MVEAVVELYEGDRALLGALFALADDSSAAVARYRDEGTLIVARQESAIVGLALLTFSADNVAELKSLAVDPRQQGQGLGAALVEASVAEAKRAGATTLQVSTAAADTANLRFYQKAGFRMLRICRDAFTPATGYNGDLRVDGILLRDQVVFDRQL